MAPHGTLSSPIEIDLTKSFTEKVQRDGSVISYDKNGWPHRDDGLPAVDRSKGEGCGLKAWYRHGKLHNTAGPAVEWKNAAPEYWVHGVKQAAPQI